MKNLIPTDNIFKTLYKTGFVLSILIFINILFGPLVRATNSGLACPDWPLCHGKVIPPAEFRIYMEVGHRFYSGIISLVFLFLLGMIFSKKPLRTHFSILAFASLTALISQITLGALTVTKLLDPSTVNFHLLNAVIFFMFIITITLKARNLYNSPNANFNLLEKKDFGLFALSILVVLVFAQLFMGGKVSSHYAGLACTEWPTCNKGIWFPSFSGPLGYQIQHRLMAYFLFLTTTILVIFQKRFFTESSVRVFLNLAFFLLCLQIGIGIFNVLLRLPTLLTAFHTGVGVAIFISLYMGVLSKLYIIRKLDHA